jgi:hypothetical protein
MSPETDAAPLRIGGYAAYTSPIPAALPTRLRAIAMEREAREALEHDEAEAEERAREALELMVEAFLLDRSENRDCFAAAHSLGREVNLRFGCPWSFDTDRDTYENACGVLALHNRFGLSPGGPTVGCCSICRAGDFECDHVPGRRYDGERAHRVITQFDLREISLVTVPRDPRCYRVHFPKSRQEVERLRGRPLGPGDQPVCEHCRDCPGGEGPSAEDLDPDSWDPLPEG